jgi:hypothetical protein
MKSTGQPYHRLERAERQCSKPAWLSGFSESRNVPFAWRRNRVKIAVYGRRSKKTRTGRTAGTAARLAALRGLWLMRAQRPMGRIAEKGERVMAYSCEYCGPLEVETTADGVRYVLMPPALKAVTCKIYLRQSADLTERGLYACCEEQGWSAAELLEREVS